MITNKQVCCMYDALVQAQLYFIFIALCLKVSAGICESVFVSNNNISLKELVPTIYIQKWKVPTQEDHSVLCTMRTVYYEIYGNTSLMF